MADIGDPSDETMADGRCMRAEVPVLTPYSSLATRQSSNQFDVALTAQSVRHTQTQSTSRKTPAPAVP